MKKFIIFVVILWLTFFFIGCGPRGSGVELESITINCEKTEISIEDTLQLTVTANPKGASARVDWSSSHPEIVSVSASGSITGKSQGTATITAVSKVNPKISDEITITVIPTVYSDPESLEIVERSTLALNFAHKIQFTVYPLTAKQEVEFSSSDDSVAAVDKNGVVKGKALGKTTITVRVVADNSIEKSFELTVSASGDSTKPDNIVIQGETEVEEGDSIQLSATVYPLGVSQEVIWSVSDAARATITENGKFTGLKQGT
ncbi:MAG: Ig-like domain-containing protein, partial [Bacilli bacterium]|nr:Ig-like domain-containing protein [Bacilli bacterium]